MRRLPLNKRSSSLDIQVAPNSRPTQPATMVRVQIQARNNQCRRQRDGQLQLCVPLVATDGESYRMKEARTRQGGRPTKR